MKATKDLPQFPVLRGLTARCIWAMAQGFTTAHEREQWILNAIERAFDGGLIDSERQRTDCPPLLSDVPMLRLAWEEGIRLHAQVGTNGRRILPTTDADRDCSVPASSRMREGIISLRVDTAP